VIRQRQELFYMLFVSRITRANRSRAQLILALLTVAVG
jgi:hypothetical protein